MDNAFHLVKLAAYPPQRRLGPFSEGPARPHAKYVVRIWAPITEEPTEENESEGRPTENVGIRSLPPDESPVSQSRKVCQNRTWIMCTGLWFSILAVFLFYLWLQGFGNSDSR